MAQAPTITRRRKRRRVEELVEEARERGAYTLTGMHEVEVDGEKHMVEVKEARAWIDDAGKLRIWVKATVDGVETVREFVFGRYNDRVECRLRPRTSAPGRREGDKKRIEALSLVIFGDKPGTVSGGEKLIYTRRRLEHATRYREIKDAAEKWLTLT